jgi:hypothetical protein
MIISDAAIRPNQRSATMTGCCAVMKPTNNYANDSQNIEKSGIGDLNEAWSVAAPATALLSPEPHRR